MKKIKKVLAFILSLCMLLNVSPLEAYAENGSGGGGTSSLSLESGVQYIVPLIFYQNTGNLQTGNLYGSGGGIWGILDDIALVTKNDNGTYHVTLQVENYKKIDIFQISKPGVISDEVMPDKVPMGTYNIPEKYFRTDPSKENATEEITAYLKEQGKMDETWNDKYFQKSEIDVVEGSQGVCWYSFDVDTLESSLYVKSFYSYRNTAQSSMTGFLRGILTGKFEFNIKQMEAVNDIATGTYNDFGLDISKVQARTADTYFHRPLPAQIANDCLSAQATAVVENGGGISVDGSISQEANVSSLQVLTEMADFGESSIFPSDTRFGQYQYAYSKETVTQSSQTVDVSIYSDNLLKDGRFTVDYSCLQEALFGRQIKIVTGDGSNYYGELRLRTTPKQEIKKSDQGVTLVTNSYTVSDQAEFKAELLQENTDENSEYNKFYSLLAGNASKALIYNLSLKENNEQVSLSRAVDLRVEIPDDWDTDKIEIQWMGDFWTIFNPLTLATDASYQNEDGSARMDGNELIIKQLDRVHGTIAITQKADKADISSIQDGVYKVNVTMWQQEQPDRLSMSNSAVISDSARLEVSNSGAEKWIYFDTQGVEIASQYGYANNIRWANNEADSKDVAAVLNTFTPLEYYSYYLNESGSTQMDSYAKDYDLYYPKTVGFQLPQSADRDGGAYLEFCVPIMDELQNKVPGSGEGSRVAFMTLSGLVQQGEIDTPVHDASVLVVAAAKASKYNVDDYTEESAKVLSDALEKAQPIISGSEKATDEEIVTLDKQIAAAIAGLTEDPERKNTVKAELSQAITEAETNYAKADYTAESFQRLESAIAAAKEILNNEDAAISEMKAQIAKLDTAIAALDVNAEIPADVQELQELIESALKETNDGIYTESSWNSFQAAIASAQKILSSEKATAADREKQKNLLNAVREALVLQNKQNAAAYSVAVKLLNAMTDEASMGNDSMVQTATIRVSDEGDMTLELDFQPMKFAGLTGYLYKLKKVDMDSVKYNQYGYPAEYTASDVQLLEEYTDTYDQFNDQNSEYYDAKTEGGWYPKKLSIPIQPNDNLFYVEVYVPVMESIGEGQGTKVARLSIGWEDIANRDNSALDALLEQVSQMTADGISEESWNVLQAVFLTAQEVRKDINATQEEIDRQTAALQAAIHAVETATEEPAADKTALIALIQTAQAESSRTDVYTAETLDKLKLAIENAQAVAAKENATQAEVEVQITALEAAIQALEKQPESQTPSNPSGGAINTPMASPEPLPSVAPTGTPAPAPTPGSTTETTIKDDGTKVTTTTTIDADGSQKQEVIEERPDGSKMESTTVTNTDGSSQATQTETAADGSVTKTTVTNTAADGSATKTERTTETNSKGAEVEKTVVTKTDTTGNVTSVKETSVFEPVSSAEATVTVTKDGSDNVTAAKAAIVNTTSGSKVTLSAAIAEQVTEAAGQEDVVITLTAKKANGDIAYQMTVNASNVKSGEDLYVYAYNKKTKEYTLVNAKTYTIKNTNLSMSLKNNKANEIYRLVNNQRSTAIFNKILKTVKLAKPSVSVKKGKKTNLTFSSKLNTANVKKITYSTSKKTVAAVNKNGKITAKGKGTATIKAKVTLINGKVKTVRMKVKVK